MKRIPYPMRALKISVEFKPFGFWLKPSFTNNSDKPERYKSEGGAIYIFRWMQTQIVVSRWL